MKQTPQEKRILKNFAIGAIAKNGFIGDDTRHLHDIISDDKKTLTSLGLSCEDAADILHFYLEEGKKGLDGEIDFGSISVQTRWDRGMIPCPFGERGLHPKIVTTVTDKITRKKIRYSKLSIHLIRQHGFFGGKGSVFRIEPEDCIELIKKRKKTKPGSNLV